MKSTTDNAADAQRGKASVIQSDVATLPAFQLSILRVAATYCHISGHSLLTARLAMATLRQPVTVGMMKLGRYTSACRIPPFLNARKRVSHVVSGPENGNARSAPTAPLTFRKIPILSGLWFHGELARADGCSRFKNMTAPRRHALSRDTQKMSGLMKQNGI